MPGGARAVVAVASLVACQGPSVDSVPPETAAVRAPAPAPRVVAGPDLPSTPTELGHGSLFGHDDGDTVLAHAGDLEVRKHHVLDRLLETDPERVREVVELLLLDARVRKLSKQLGVEVPETDLRLAVRREWARVERLFARRPAGAADVDDYVRRNYAMQPEDFRARLRLLAWRRLLRSYTLRYAARRRGSVALDYFFHSDERVARSVRLRIVQGADFRVLARAQSEDRSARSGGRLPDLPPDFDHPALRLARSLAPGTLSGVQRVERTGGGGWGFVRVRGRRPPDTRPFAAQVDAIRHDLETRPVDSSELALFVLGR